MGIVTLLLNTLFILICILIYQFFWLDREDNDPKNELLISLFAATALVLCMTFPFQLRSGFIYDLRMVPIILCFLYGGIRSIAFVGIVYLSYRYYLGGAGLFSSMVIYFTICMIVACSYYFTPAFFKHWKKTLGIVLIILSTVFLFIMGELHEQSLSHLIDSSYVGLFPIHFLINLITMAVSLYLIDEMLEKRRLKERIRRTEKMFILGELSATFAHELRNPLTTVHGFIQLMMSSLVFETKRTEYLRIMMTELELAESYLAEFLKLTKPSDDAREPVDLGELIGEVSEALLNLAAENHVEIRSEVNSTVVIEASRIKVKQCLFNLMKNGIEAMTEGGILRIILKRNRKNVVIDIIDTGVGMTREEIKRIGLPFYSTKVRGTGLGTIISYSIIKDLNGDVEIVSKKGKGTCFTITLPLIQQ